VERIFRTSVALYGKGALEREVVIDTTVQEKNITFPLSHWSKLRVKDMRRCWKLATAEDIRLRRSYRRELKKTLQIVRFSRSQKDKKKVSAVVRWIKIMANALLRDVMRNLPESSLAGRHEELERSRRIINQQRHVENKIYSLHELAVSCISKGKDHKKYEFEAKAAFAMAVNE
jgi:IS5 family transposase